MSRLLKEDPNTKLQDLVKETIFVTKKKRIYPRSPRQLAYFQAIQKNDLVFWCWSCRNRKVIWPWQWLCLH